jgi:hypothetical protein
MSAPWYVLSEEGRFLLDSFIIESTNSCWYSWSIGSCLMFLISLLKSFWSWHMILARLTKLWTTPLFTWYGRLSRFPVHFRDQLGPLFMTKTSENGRIPFTSTYIVNLMVALRLLRWRRISCNFCSLATWSSKLYHWMFSVCRDREWRVAKQFGRGVRRSCPCVHLERQRIDWVIHKLSGDRLSTEDVT